MGKGAGYQDWQSDVHWQDSHGGGENWLPQEHHGMCTATQTMPNAGENEATGESSIAGGIWKPVGRLDIV